MFDVGWTELLVIGALALIVVGPRDLPRLMRTVGQTVGKVKRMAREFQRSLEDAASEADLAELKELRDLKKQLGGLDFRQQAAKAQSFLNQPVTPEKSGQRAATATDAAKTAAGSERKPAGDDAAATTPESKPADGKAAEAPVIAEAKPAPVASQPAARPAVTETSGPTRPASAGEDGAPDTGPDKRHRASAGG